MSKKTNALKQAARRKPKHKRKKRPNPAYGWLPEGQPRMFPPPPLLDFAFDMVLLEALRRSGIRDALLKLIETAQKKPNDSVTSEETVQ